MKKELTVVVSDTGDEQEGTHIIMTLPPLPKYIYSW